MPRDVVFLLSLAEEEGYGCHRVGAMAVSSSSKRCPAEAQIELANSRCLWLVGSVVCPSLTFPSALSFSILACSSVNLLAVCLSKGRVELNIRARFRTKRHS